MRGFAVSPGRVTATASVVLSPADFLTMRPGARPSHRHWGVAAHGSILAREYGIPAVMGTGNATLRIASGQLVTVDGDTGTVTLLEEG